MDSHDFSGAAEHEALKAAFSATSYEAFGLGQEFSLRVDRNHPDLDALLLTTAREPWAFLTAWNPRSTPTGKSQNIAANQALAKQLAQLTDQDDRPLLVLPGRGVGPDESWTPEESFLVLGISSEQAEALCKQFNQWARLAGERGSLAGLIWTDFSNCQPS